MDERLKIVPKKMAEWLAETNKNWPGVNFEINCREPYLREEEEFERFSQECSRIFYFHRGQGGVRCVEFPYAKQRWWIRIIGKIDETGKITNAKNPDYTKDSADIMPAALKNRIAGIPEEPTLKILAPGIKGIPRKDEPVSDFPKELVSIVFNIPY